MDRFATWIITAGGVAIIGVVILIMILIVRVAVPLFLPASATLEARMAAPNLADMDEVIAVDVDEYLESGVILDRNGRARYFSLETGESLLELPLGRDGARLLWAERFDNHRYSLHWVDDQVSVIELQFITEFGAGGARTITREVRQLAALPAPDWGAPITRAVARAEPGDGAAVRVDVLADNRLGVTQRVVREDLFGEREVEETSALTEPAPGHITAITITDDGQSVYVGTEHGRVLGWSLRRPGAPELRDDVVAAQDGASITALGMVFGDRSVAVGDAAGRLATWFRAPMHPDAPERRLQRIHPLETHPATVERITQSRRNKSLLSLNADGAAHLDHMTSERHLVRVTSDAPLRHVRVSTRENGIFGLDAAGAWSLWSLHNPHPHASWRTLFGRVWYEDYPAPDFVWQSTGGTDDAEPKLSLVPLLFGSLKGTFYAMLYAVPLALFGALYTSQFMPVKIRGWVKSTVELMAAIPSVVIGFLIALWLAPLMERWLVSFLLAMGFFPLSFVTFILLWQPFRRLAIVQRIERGYEFLVIAPVILLAGYCSYLCGGWVELQVFGGDLRNWLFEEAGQRYDQRNSIIIAFGLGFAVIPIIFTITEDAMSNVPQSLKAASQAMGASRWQTAWTIVLPSASPGIFAAIIIGLGRAIGETMIVLMATGNTPIMDMSIFNGMRTLAANIAVEIPEAPVDGTLYRVLFLSAVLLLLLTSALNTVAELVRQRLRTKYGLYG